MSQLRLLVIVALLLGVSGIRAEDDSFTQQVAPIFEQRCVSCHGGKSPRGGLSLTTSKLALQGGATGAVIVPGKPDTSLLIEKISGTKPAMPRGGPALKPDQVATLRKWIEQGAKWPEGVTLKDRSSTETWWSFRPLTKVELPAMKKKEWVRTPIDAFILARLEKEGLTPSAEADRRTLIRRLSFDLHGLPPTPDEIDVFVKDTDPKAYEKLVEKLLASPRYGERWARHWLDVVHYGDTHGYDKDKLRPNAWPYRDYVIRAFNEDRPYSRFVKEQIAGDVFYSDTRDGIAGLGFLAAGPWDFVGQVELREGTLDKKITRTLDRDDMVATTINTFTSLTVQCARCHDHKFDPIAQEDYYSLQAVFAAVDRADRPYEVDPAVAAKRIELKKTLATLSEKRQKLDAKVREQAGPELAKIDAELAELQKKQKTPVRPEFGYHSQISAKQDVVKWVQVDLGQAQEVASLIYVGCHDNFNNIGAGFGFPVRFKIEISEDAEFKNATIVVDQTKIDFPNPGVKPQSVQVGGKKARHVRVTATKLAPRQNDYIFALAELAVLDAKGVNLAAGKGVSALDSIEAPVRWRKSNLVDGYFYDAVPANVLPRITALNEQRKKILDRVGGTVKADIETIEREQKETEKKLTALPPPGMVYAAATHFTGAGGFMPTLGKPRPIFVLHRGSEKNPRQEVGPGTVQFLPDLEGRFKLKPDDNEGERRAALVRWIIDDKNPLTWRSAINRVWHYHFGVGLVDTPNDFGQMGSKPSHPELLDWLAVEFRDKGQSLKHLHRLIVLSNTYRQVAAHNPAAAKVDKDNRLLWRMNRRRLEAEALRDSVLAVSGKLDLKMEGPGFRPFGFKDDHSPHYKYEEYDPDEVTAHRRSIYRFIVRSVPDPFMETLDCADPSLQVEKRNETLTALQALALLNNKFMVKMAGHFAARLEKQGKTLDEQVTAGCRYALGREPTKDETALLRGYAEKHGLANLCRLLLNMNEFCFVD